MEKITDFIGRELVWVQPRALIMDYELRDGESIVATLQFQNRLGLYASAKSADGAWNYERIGFLQNKVSIRSSESKTDLAVYCINEWVNGGLLEFADGRKYPIRSNFWGTQCSIKSESGEEMVLYTKIDGLLHMSARVHVKTVARDIPDTPWIVLFGWYLAVMAYMNALPIQRPAARR